MAKKIVVAGATGHLGGLTVAALIKQGAEVIALVRQGTRSDKTTHLTEHGATVVPVDYADTSALTRACAGASCVVSALLGLRDVIVDVQSNLVNAAVAANVPRFIPSDFSADLTRIPKGQNRNFDLRKEFHERLDQSPIAATSILNGAFSYLIGNHSPFIDYDAHMVRYWGDPDQVLDFTTIENAAEYTALAALDNTTPRVLRIAGIQVSARELAGVAEDILNQKFELVSQGSLDELGTLIQQQRSARPESENEVFPPWQGMQYSYGMFSGQGKLSPLDNDRYPNFHWTNLREVIMAARASG